MQKNLKSNIWKLFLYHLTIRRNFAPLVAIFFLTLPGATAKQIGLYTAIGFFTGFLFEIPSGYISDTIGHKKTLILAKIFMIVSTSLFIIANSWIYFALASTFMALGFAFSSGTNEAFLHNTLIEMKKDNKYTKISSKMHANVSLLSMAIILLLPTLTNISIIFPFKIYLGIDIIGLLISFFLITPKIKITAKDEDAIPLPKQLKQFLKIGFYPIAIFSGLITGAVFGSVNFNSPYVTSLGLPLAFIGIMMAGARLVWFLFGHYAHKIEKIKIKKIMIFETFLFPILFILISLTKNPYIATILIAITSGYMFGRGAIYNNYFLTNFSINKKYKATMLSTKSQIKEIISSIIAFGIGFIMIKSYKLGYLTLGITLFIFLIISYNLSKKHLK